MTPVRLVQLVDANDMDVDGTPPTRRLSTGRTTGPSSGKKKLLERTFGYFTTNAGLKEIAKYADGVGPWKVYIVDRAPDDINGDGTSATRTATAKVDERDRKVRRRRRSSTARTPRGLDVHTWTFRNERAGSPTDDGGDPLRRVRAATSRSASTGSSPTSRTPPWRRATRSSAAETASAGAEAG